jgi:MFS family permease
MTSWRTGWVVSIFFLGGVLGAGCSSWMNDALGRRTPLLAAGVLTTVAALLGMTTDTFWWLICVRCLFGFAMGINKCVRTHSRSVRPCSTLFSRSPARQRLAGDLLRRDHPKG